MYQNCYVDSYNRQAYVWDDILGLQTFPYKRYCYVKDEDGEFTTMFGDSCRKTFNWKDENPDDLFESDVNPTTRTLVDLYTDDDTPSINHTILTYDIEVETTVGFPHANKAENTVTSIAAHDNVSQTYVVFILDPEGRVKRTVTPTRIVEPFEDEESLLMAFVNYWVDISPTIVTGWNTSGFDNPYVINRVGKILGEDHVKRLSPIGIVKFSEYGNVWRIAGVSLLDYMQLYKKFTYTKSASYSLEAISQQELKRGKIKYSGNLNELLKDDINKFIEYNITDVELVLSLDAKLQLIDLARGIAHAGRVCYEDFIHSSKYLEGALLTYLKQNNVVSINKPKRDFQIDESNSSKASFTGAYVKIPQGGLYDWVYDLDLTSLYPSIIMSLNISPETKVGKVENWNADDFRNETRKKWVLDGDIVSHKQLKKFFKEGGVSISSNGIIYRTDIQGCIPNVLSKWFDKRVKFKKLMQKYGNEGDDKKYKFYKQRQLVQKILLNSLYGVLGLSVFRFYDLDNALAVTSVGQNVIKNTAKAINHKYNKELESGNKDYNIYIDTDSVYFSAKPLLDARFEDLEDWDDDKVAKATYDIAEEVQNFTNSFYDVLAYRMFNLKIHRLEIKKESVARRALWVAAKKAYAQWIIIDDGVPVNELKVTGLATVRSSFPPAFKKVMTDVLNGIVLENLEQEKVDSIILDFKKVMKTLTPLDMARVSSVNTLKKYKLPTSNSGKVGVFKKGTPIQVKAAMAYNDLLKYFECSYDFPPIVNNSKVKWVYLKDNPLKLDQLAFKGEDDPVEIMEYVTEYMNVNKIYDTELDNKLGRIYEALRWTKPTTNSALVNKFFTLS